MKNYLFISLIIINIVIIQGCATTTRDFFGNNTGEEEPDTVGYATTTKDFFGNLEYHDNTSFKCDIFIDNLYTSDKVFNEYLSVADKTLSIVAIINFPLLFDQQPYYEPITFLPVKDKKTGLACFEDETMIYYADILEGVVNGQVIVYHKKSGKIMSNYLADNGKVIKYQGVYINPSSEILDYYTVDYNLNTIEMYNKNKIIARFDMAKNISKYYYDNEHLSKELTFKNKKLDGIARYYYKSGALQEERHYENGLRNGNTERYSEKGALWATITYEDDKPVSGICGNGRKWTKAELINWENGVEVTCGYQ